MAADVPKWPFITHFVGCKPCDGSPAAEPFQKCKAGLEVRRPNFRSIGKRSNCPKFPDPASAFPERPPEDFCTLRSDGQLCAYSVS